MKKAIIPFISVLFFSYLSAQGFQFAQTVTVDDNQENSYDLTFGFSPDATDGYDDIRQGVIHVQDPLFFVPLRCKR